MRTLTFLGLFLLAACGGPPAPVAGGPRRVVVLELQNPAGLTGQEVAYVGELVRGAALHLPAARYRILTRENLTELIGPDVDLADCTGDCEIETARRIGADFVVTGEAVRFGEGLRVVLKLHDARTAALLGTDRASARTVEGLERPVEAAGQRLFAALGAGGREAPQAVDPGQYVRVEPGEFTAGSPEGEPGRAAHEAQARVRIPRPFLIKITEVTRAEWRRHFDRDPSRFTGCGDDCPVEQVSWYDALAYLNALSKREGLEECYVLSSCSGDASGGCEEGKGSCTGGHKCEAVLYRGVSCEGYRLPSEAEWE
ncbi:MAG: SUMF1/EgtB/PvdO family nonheme iron enzyme, partial [Myxococcales bacterium]|nr:SUMF1/EgtB/PvdO family nonheme iron enzyme [Myxococcales bacterium]